jgi:hypothetical protein
MQGDERHLSREAKEEEKGQKLFSFNEAKYYYYYMAQINIHTPAIHIFLGESSLEGHLRTSKINDGIAHVKYLNRQQFSPPSSSSSRLATT